MTGNPFGLVFKWSGEFILNFKNTFILLILLNHLGMFRLLCSLINICNHGWVVITIDLVFKLTLKSQFVQIYICDLCVWEMDLSATSNKNNVKWTCQLSVTGKCCANHYPQDPVLRPHRRESQWPEFPLESNGVSSNRNL